MDENSRPIGVFDSGAGGISVLKELVKCLPGEDFLYFGDSANAPYGTKSTELIRELTIKNIKHLMDEGVKGIVIACNTATGAAVADLRDIYKEIPVVGIEPAIKPAASQNPGKRIGVMATPMTLKQEKFQNLMAKYKDMADIISIPCPGLMEYVEAGEIKGEKVRRFIKSLIGDINPDAVVLGCTHYPFLRGEIRSVLGEDVKIYDGGSGTAREMKRRLEEKSLLSEKKSGKIIFENSYEDDVLSAKEKALCEMLMKVFC